MIYNNYIKQTGAKRESIMIALVMLFGQEEIITLL